MHGNPAATLSLQSWKDVVDGAHCGFVDDKTPEAALEERTLVDTNCDVSTPEITVRSYLGEDGAVLGTNHMKTRMSEPVTRGFD